jgi:hypothetical protein
VSAHRSVRRRLVAVGAALAVLVSLFPMVGAAAVVADACPVGIPSAGYRDLGGLSAEAIDAIDCVSHYGVAQGVAGDRFDPQGDVTRWQMALFLVRIADDLGIVVPETATARFDDIANYPTDVQRAINQLAALGVTSGVAPRRYDPAAVVTRWQMALFLTRMHALTEYLLPGGANQGFADIGTYPAATQVAINQLAEIGLARGTTSTTYSPAAAVKRWQMALFLARHLEATAAAPYRVDVEAVPSQSPTNGQIKLTVTVKTPAGVPVAGRHVDVFAGTLDLGNRCVVDTDSSLNGGDGATGTNCRLDTGDPKTDGFGRVQLTLTHTNVQEVNRVYAWIGEIGQTFVAGEVPYVASVEIQWIGTAAALVMPAKTAKFGTTVSAFGWLTDSTGTRIAVADQQVVVSVRRGNSVILTETLKTDADGRFVLAYRGPSDPNGSADNPPVVDTVTAFWDKDRDGVDDGAAEFDVTTTITWDDETPRNDKAVLHQDSQTTLAGQAVTVTATVTDKFGAALRNAEVVFIVEGANPGTAAILTNTSGVASWTYVAANGGVDTIDATVDIGDDGSIDLGRDVIDDLTHLTVVTGPDLPGSTTFTVLAVNTSANTVDVSNGGGYYRLRWDSNDMFTAGASNSMSAFENALNALTLPAAGALTTNPYDSNAANVSTFVVNS